MNTTSIKDIMEIKFGIKDSYSQQEYDSVTELIINRFDVVGEIINVNFDDLLLFKNLQNLVIKQCIIDSDTMNIILQLNNLKSLFLDDCEIVDDISLFFDNLNIDTLVLNSINFDLNELEKVKTNNLYLYNVIFNQNLNINVLKLDISNCLIADSITIDCGGLETLVISIKMYKNIDQEINNFHGHLIVMEENGQFIYEERDI